MTPREALRLLHDTFGRDAIERKNILDASVILEAALVDMERRAFPDQLTPALREVLGMMNFETCPLAHAFQAVGYDIPRQTEAEQAFILHWLVWLVLRYGDDWKPQAAAELDRIREIIRTREAVE